VNAMAPTRRSLSEFNIETQIGKGSFARVYRVTRNSDHKRYAIKEVNLRQMTQKEREDAVNEVRLLASIRHDRVIRYFDAFIESDRMYIVMEYAKGGDLYMKMKKHKEKKIFLEEKTILDIFAQVCEGVATLHSLGVVHRDIKSPNVFMMGGGIVKVGDLGIATLLKGRNATARIGTPYYMSPELWRAQPYNQKSDMWALGCLLYEMTCLRHPFDAKDEKTLGRKVVRGFYQAPPKGYSKELVKTIKSLLQVDPEKRPSIIDLLNSPFLRRRLEEDDALWLEQDFVLGVPSLLDTIKVPKDIAKLCDHLPSNCYAEERISIRPSMSQSVPVTRRTVEEDEDTLPAIAPKTAPPDETTAVVSNNAENSKEGRSGGVNSSLACRSERSLDGHVSPFDGGKESERSGIIGPSPPSVEKVKKSRPAVIRVRENPLAGQGKPHHGKGGHKSEGHHHNHNHHHHASHHHHHGGHQRSSLDEKQPQHPELEDEQEAGQREKGKGMESESAKKKPGHEKERTKNSDGHTHMRRKETSKGGGDSHHKEGMTRLPKLSNVNINSLKMRYVNKRMYVLEPPDVRCSNSYRRSTLVLATYSHMCTSTRLTRSCLSLHDSVPFITK